MRLWNLDGFRCAGFSVGYIMSKITIYAVGKLRAIFKESATLYHKRLPDISIVEVASSKDKNPDIAMSQEARALSQKLQKNIGQNTLTIVLDATGEMLSSEDLAGLISHAEQEGQKIRFIIGGANGIAPDLLTQADRKIAFGKNIWPHELVRVMLLEQLYRANAIKNRHPYHGGH